MASKLSVGLNVAESTKIVKYVTPSHGQKMRTANLQCPRSFNGSCPLTWHTWSCSRCAMTLKYGYDKFFYCACGRAPTNSFKFKCSDPRHGDDFEEFPERDLNYLLVRMRALKEINILILGETGVGKSTWINGIANYATFATFEDAESGNPVSLIPSVHQITVGGRKHEVFVGDPADKDKVEKTDAGQSVTQFPASYVFKYHDFAIRLIDTPGIGDTRGLETDKTNLQNVLDHLSHFDELHGICILLPPNQARLTVAFKFCLKQLLKQLHRDACKNIVFCFTRSRATDYNPGETVDVLRALFRENADVEIPLTAKTMFCVDSETVIYLFAKRSSITMADAAIRQTRKESWETSVRETGRLLENIMKLKPHELRKTLSLNETRRVILAICNGPLVNISFCIQANLRQLKTTAVEIKKPNVSAEELLKEAAVSCRYIPLKRPRVVCRSEACTLSVGTVHLALREDLDLVQSEQICCDSCLAPHMRLCESFRLLGKCKVCSCRIAYHSLTNYDVVYVRGQLTDEQLGEALRSEKTDGRKLSVVASKVTKLVGIEKQEQQFILETAAKLMRFLELNSVISQTDAFAECLRRQLRLAQSVGKSQIKENLKKMLEEYEALISEEKRQPVQTTMTADDVRRLVETLYALELHGQGLKEAVEAVEKSSAELVKQCDIELTPDLQVIDPAKRNSVQKVLMTEQK